VGKYDREKQKEREIHKVNQNAPVWGLLNALIAYDEIGHTLAE